jgi:MoaA/NifB/PqqE/SkfB family radical SAM enzyme
MKKLHFPEISKRFEGMMPNGFVNAAQGWSFRKEELVEAAKGKRLLTLDLDMAGTGVCSLNCGHCFRRNKEFGKEKRMDFDEVEKHLREAKGLGLRSVKIIGPGEPIEDPELFRLLSLFRELDIVPLLFTKGRVFGDDPACIQVHGFDGHELLRRLYEMDTSILMGSTSFDPETEDKTVGRKGYHEARNEALVRLNETGFMDFVPGLSTRCALIFNPLTPRNIDEAFDVYVWARERNIQPIMGPTMVAGRALDKLKQICPTDEELIDTFTRINIWAIEHGIYTLTELQEHGISAYAGGTHCHQVSCGLFVRGDGAVLRCPGDDISIQGNLRERSLTEIWIGSENLRLHAGAYNNFCPPKEGKSFPNGFFPEVLRRVMLHFVADSKS